MPNALKCPECGGKVSPGQERCDHCGVWFKNSTSPTLSAIMADNDLDNKPIETISYYGHAYVSGRSGVGVSVSGNVVLSPSSPGGVRRVVKRVAGRVVEETSEYVIVMTRKDQLVKIRPEDIIRRGLGTRGLTAEKKRVATRNGLVMGVIGSVPAIILIAAGVSWVVWWAFAFFGIIGFAGAAILSHTKVDA